MKQRGTKGRYRTTILPRPCKHCGEQFKPHGVTQRYCSQPCAWASRRGSWTGARNPRYNGGLSAWPDGRAVVCCSDGSVVTFARAVVEAEIRRPLRSDEIVHHLNGDHTDDRLENLEITTRADHIEIHRDELLRGRGITRRKAA